VKRGLSFFLCLLIVGFLAVSPSLIAAGLDRNIYAIRQKNAEDDYRGTLKFWHVVSFKTGSKSGYEYLKARCSRFERSVPYVFIELRGMTVDEAKHRLAEGEMPDMISFPKGQIGDADMLEIPADKNHLPNFSGFSRCAQPYMADSYVLVINETLLRELGLPQNYSGELSRELFYDAYEKLGGAGIVPVSATETAGLDPRETLNHLILTSDESYPEEIGINGDVAVQAGRDAFLSEQAGMYICPYSEFILQQKEGYDFDASAYNFSDYTDIVQMLGAYKSDDEAKNEMMQRFIEGFFGEKMQKELQTLSMLPCTHVDGIYESDAERWESYKRICEKAVKSK